jgi:hypothetical protein
VAESIISTPAGLYLLDGVQRPPEQALQPLESQAFGAVRTGIITISDAI